MNVRAAARRATDRAWRAAADLRRRASGSADRAFLAAVLGDADRGDRDAWHEATERATHRLRARLPLVEAQAAIVCVSMRPALLPDVVTHVQRQRHGGLAADPEVVFVANSDAFETSRVEAAFAHVPRARVLHPKEPVSLGAALNLALDATDARFVAKFDDDDRYGTFHLADSLRIHSFAGAGVVGKHTYYADVQDTGGALLRFPHHEFKTSGTLAGGSLVIDRDRTGDLRFEEISLGEDRAFISACHRRGIATFSGDRFGFVQIRHETNTWRPSTQRFAAASVPVDRNELERILQ